MIVGELVTAIQRQFGDDSGVQITRTDIVRWINQASVDIVRQTNCVQDHKQADSVASDGSYSLPDDTIAVRRVTFADTVLIQTTLDVADQDWTTRDLSPQTGGNPRYYYIWNNIIYLYPVPATSVAGTLDIWYVRTPAIVSGDNDTLEVPAKFHELIVTYAVARAKELNDEYDIGKLKMQEYDQDILDARDETNRPNARTYNAVRLLPGDDW